MIDENGDLVKLKTGIVAYFGDVNLEQLFAAMHSTLIKSDWTLRNIQSDETPRDPSVAPGPWSDAYILVTESVAQAREILPYLTIEGVAKTIILAINSWDGSAGEIPFSSTSIRFPASLKIFAPSRNSPYTFFLGEFSKWNSVHSFISEVVGCDINGRRRLPWGGQRIGVGSSEGLAWALGDALARWTDPRLESSQIEVVDSVDRISIDQRMPEKIGARIDKQDPISKTVIPPIDAAIFSPRTFEVFPEFNTLQFRNSSHDRWFLEYEGKQLGHEFSTLNEQIIFEIQRYSAIDVLESANSTAWGLARIISQLSTSGVLLHVNAITDEVAALIGPKLSKVIVEHHGPSSIPEVRESQSIELRREGMRHFLPQHRLGKFGLLNTVSDSAWPTVSIVLASRRPALLDQILLQIARQTYPRVEIILAIHGHSELPADVQQEICGFPGPISVLHFEESIPLGEVLNRACSQAEGQLITKMDDDDWYSPNHIEDLVLSRMHSGAGLVGSPVEFSYLEGPDITTRRKHRGECFTNHVAGGTIMISRTDLSEIGGWRPVPKAVDRGLIDAAIASGMDIYRTHGQNYVMNRRIATDSESRHTWEADYSVFLRDVVGQWNGLVFPPQFGESIISTSGTERAVEFQSILSFHTNDNRIRFQKIL